MDSFLNDFLYRIPELGPLGFVAFFLLGIVLIGMPIQIVWWLIQAIISEIKGKKKGD
jgi:hypothetical protein